MRLNNLFRFKKVIRHAYLFLSFTIVDFFHTRMSLTCDSQQITRLILHTLSNSFDTMMLLFFLYTRI